MAEVIPSEVDYRAAKDRYASWTEAQHQDPTSEMLRDVDMINTYERAQDATP